MENKDDIQKELNELAPKLGSMEKKNLFPVPDYYFQSLPDKLLARVKNEPQPWTERLENSLNRIFSRIFQPRYTVTFATSLVLLAVAIGFLKKKETDNGAPQLSQIPTEEIDAYILADLDEFEIIGLNTTTEISSETERIIPDNISDEELNNYLNDNIDNQTLEEEFL
ncbi:MAG: hypothetical protein SH857_07965 [Chitinophagales bacterium]|nr:hypothetical protein [Chitinophagales bacterium]